jgi:eIF-2B alpha/beta/delta-like uncharacterized protein
MDNSKKQQTVEEIYEDIKNLNIQGATNVGIATLEGMKIVLDSSKEKDNQKLFDEVMREGNRLAHARTNEPLATNGVTFVEYFLKNEFSVLPEIGTMKRTLMDLCDRYLELIGNTKADLVEKNYRLLTNYDKILTHCHSSTAVKLIKKLGKKDDNFEVVCTETRPMYQGRKTAVSLIGAGIKTTMIVDSAVESFIINRGSVPVDAVFIGCDQFTEKGYVVNKIGSWGLAMAAFYADKPLYVVTPLLKIDAESFHTGIEIEIREDRELWEDAPKELDMYNPAFEIVDNNLITGFVTEYGIVKPRDIGQVVRQVYPWLKFD